MLASLTESEDFVDPVLDGLTWNTLPYYDPQGRLSPDCRAFDGDPA